jgi:hypothetical protein
VHQAGEEGARGGAFQGGGVTTEERLNEAERVLQNICGLQILMSNRVASWQDYAIWRQELAREYLVKYGLFKDAA